MPVSNRHVLDNLLSKNENEENRNAGSAINVKRKKTRRSIAKRVNNRVMNIMYSNIQGFTKKKENLVYTSWKKLTVMSAC